MHLAVDAANLARDRRGIGRYVRALLVRWLDRPRDVRLTLLVPDLLLGPARRRLSQALGRDDFELRRRGDTTRLRPDLVWYPWNGMTWTTDLPAVATVHDVWPFVSPAADAATRRREQTFYLTMARRSRAIIANSHFTKSEIVRYLAVAPERVHVVHMGVDMPEDDRGVGPARIRIDGAQRYVVFVGEDEPRKDLVTLRAAMGSLPEHLRASTGLLVVGKPRGGPRPGRIASSSDAWGDALELTFDRTPSGPVLVAGEVSDRLLDHLYARASALVCPSRYEGFGLPVLEAMARGVAVVASSAASLPEVGGDAALYFPCGDPQRLASVLARVLDDPAAARRLGSAGVARARELSWDRCSQETLRIFASTIQGSRA